MSKSKSAKRGFRTRLPPKVKRKHPSEHTHHAALPSRFASPAPPNNTRSHANPNVTATSPLPQLTTSRFRIHASNAHKVLRLPRNVTSVTPRNLTISCACHENRTSTPQNPHKVLRLPRKVTISSHVSFNKICTTPHVWNNFLPVLRFEGQSSNIENIFTWPKSTKRDEPMSRNRGSKRCIRLPRAEFRPSPAGGPATRDCCEWDWRDM